MSHQVKTLSLIAGCLIACTAFAQTTPAQTPSAEYGTARPHPPRIDFPSLGISADQATQVRSILRESHEYGQTREATRAQLAGVLNEAQLNALTQAQQARRANAPQGGPGCAPKTGAPAAQGVRPQARTRSAS